jgi:hypothetical protein
VAELALDDVERHAFAGKLDGVGVAQLMRRKTPPQTGLDGKPVELDPDPGARPGPATSGPVDDAEQRPDRRLDPVAEPGRPGGASEATASGEAAHVELATGHAEGERLFGVHVEATPLVVLAVLAGLALAALAASRIGLLRGFLLTVVVIGLAWAALDIREVIHQLDESRTGVAVVAMAVAALHLTVAAISGRLATQPPATL